MRDVAFGLVMFFLWLSGVMVGWYRCRLAMHCDVWERYLALQDQFLADMKEASASGDAKAWWEAMHHHDGASAVWDATWEHFERREIWHRIQRGESEGGRDKLLTVAAIPRGEEGAADT